MIQIELQHQGKATKVWAEKIQGVLWFHINGQTFRYEPQKKRSNSSSASNAEPGVINAPMPGKILKVLAAQNQEVKKGQVLLVMEAMKMEYSLKADIEGVVDQLSCAVGDQVSLGQSLVRLKG